MPKLNRLYFGTRTETTTQTGPQDYEHTFGFETDNDQNGYFSVLYGENPPGFERVQSKSFNGETITPYSGSYMAASLDPPNEQVSGMEVSFRVPVDAENATVEFWLLVHHERNEVLSNNGWYALYDHLNVSHNGTVIYDFRWCDPDDTREELANWNGVPPEAPDSEGQYETIPGGPACPYGKWFNLKFNLSPGDHRFVFDLVRDDSDGSGNVFGTRAHYVDSFVVTYTAPAGSVITKPSIPLIFFDDSEGYQLARQWDGGILPPLKHAEYSLPFHAGSVHEYTSVEARDFSLGLFIVCGDGEDIRDKTRYLANQLAMRDGALFADFEDGNKRELPCRLSEIDQQETPSTQGVGNAFKTVLTFRAFDPFWYSALEKWENPPATPAVLNNSGQYETWPIYRIYGPVTDPVITLTDPGTGEVISRMAFAYTVDIGRIMTIDSRPGYKTITLDDDTNLYHTLAADSGQMFAIPPGEWNVELTGSGTAAESKLTIHWREAYWGL